MVTNRIAACFIVGIILGAIIALTVPVSGALVTRQVTCNTTFATLLSTNGPPAGPDRPHTPFSVLLVNSNATNPVFVGNSAVGVGTGVEIKAGASLSVQLQYTEALYGVSTGGNVRVDVMENGK
jgi:hypothetical protein